MRIAMYKGPPDDFWHSVGHTATRVWTRCACASRTSTTPQRLLDAALKA